MAQMPDDELILRVFDVEHGACTVLAAPYGGAIAMIDSGHNSTTGWKPSTFIRFTLRRRVLNYLFITNADQDHMSDLDGLWQQGISVETLIRNHSPDARILRRIKEAGGELTDDVERYLRIHAEYTELAAIPFDLGMSGATCSTFCNSYPAFTDTNNLSLAVFIKYCGFKMLFPGDLEGAGWRGLLGNPAFVEELRGTDILMASHHGRFSGFCSELFEVMRPQAVVISDRPVIYGTQEMVPDYRAMVAHDGVMVERHAKRRHVLTTRRDGDIAFIVSPDGSFRVRISNP